MEHAGEGSMMASCCMYYCFPVPIAAMQGIKIANKYGIKEDMVSAGLKSCCCHCCYVLQITHEILERENLDYACASMQKKGGAGASTVKVQPAPPPEYQAEDPVKHG